MKIITINLPEKYLEAIHVLVDRRIYPSRSEVIRRALSQFLTKELKFKHDIDFESFEIIIRSGLRL